MKLYELIDFTPKKSNIDKIAYSNRVNKATKPPVDVGNGHFAQVTQHDSPKRLNQVNKVGTAGQVGGKGPDPRPRVEEDGYLSYLKMVQDDTSQNPFFPRIHDLKIRKDPETGNLTYNVKLEKLFSFDKIYDNPELVSSMREHLFNVENERVEHYSLSTLIYAACNDSDYDLVKDPQFLEAIKKIDAIATRYHHAWDIGPGNVMWRMTGTMPQLVLSDPLS